MIPSLEDTRQSLEQLANSKGQKKISEFCGAKSAFKPYDSKKKQSEAEDQQAKSDEELANEAPQAKIAAPSLSSSSKNKSPGSGSGSGQEPPQNSQMTPPSQLMTQPSNVDIEQVHGLKQTFDASGLQASGIQGPILSAGLVDSR